MGKPVKIRKKKSFMFTTRHYSLMSIIGIMIGVFCLSVVITAVLFSYRNAGNIDISFGGIGLFSAIMNIVGVLCGVMSLNERDIYISAAIAAIVINGIILAGWLIMILISAFA